MKSILTALLLLVLPMGCSQNKSKPITEFSQNDIKNGILVDVRTPEEFSAGHLENAINIDWFDPNFNERFEGVDKNKTIYVYCKKGGRSAKAARILDSLGYKKVIDLVGGYDAVMQQRLKY